MKPTRIFLGLALLASLATGAALAAGNGAHHPIVKVVTRTGTITIRVTEAGPVYTLQGKDGKILAENLSEMDLKVQHPELYQLIKPAVATSSAFPFTIDASILGE